MELRVVNYVGILFFRDGKWFLTDEDKGEVNLEEELRAMSGGQVQITIQHAPPNPPDKNRWGGGCCMWEATGQKCPAGHHKRPGYLYSVSGIGKILYISAGDKNPWCLRSGKGNPTPIYFSMLDGHRCNFAIVPFISPDDFEQTMNAPDPNNLGDLIRRAEQLKALLSRADKAGKQ